MFSDILCCCSKWFEKVVLGEECANPKPYPDPYLEGLKAFGVKPEECIVCEDSPSGGPPIQLSEACLGRPPWTACILVYKRGKAVSGNGYSICSKQTCGRVVG